MQFNIIEPSRILGVETKNRAISMQWAELIYRRKFVLSIVNLSLIVLRELKIPIRCFSFDFLDGNADCVIQA